MDPMNPEVKAQWLAALRSGEYTQGKGYLTLFDEDDTDKERDCCLGVLCKLAIKSGVAVEIRRMPEYIRYGVAGEQGALPQEVREWAGLHSQNPTVPLGEIELGGELAADHRFSTYIHLADLNDDDDDAWPFTRIADVIEKYL